MSLIHEIQICKILIDNKFTTIKEDKRNLEQDFVAHTSYSSTGEAEAKGSCIEELPELQNKILNLKLTNKI